MSEAAATRACPFCGETIKATAVKCMHCREYLDGRPRETDVDPALKFIVPVGRSGWAIAAGYLGLLSLFPFVGFLFGILAVVTGVLALKDIRKNPHLGGTGRAWFGIILGGLFTLIYGAGLIILVVGYLLAPHHA